LAIFDPLAHYPLEQLSSGWARAQAFPSISCRCGIKQLFQVAGAWPMIGSRLLIGC
jgi:hypothetical protein